MEKLEIIKRALDETYVLLAEEIESVYDDELDPRYTECMVLIEEAKVAIAELTKH